MKKELNSNIKKYDFYHDNGIWYKYFTPTMSKMKIAGQKHEYFFDKFEAHLKLGLNGAYTHWFTKYLVNNHSFWADMYGLFLMNQAKAI